MLLFIPRQLAHLYLLNLMDFTPHLKAAMGCLPGFQSDSHHVQFDADISVQEASLIYEQLVYAFANKQTTFWSTVITDWWRVSQILGCS
jgi:hypothetical protein